MTRRTFLSAALAVLVAPLAMWRKPRQYVVSMGIDWAKDKGYAAYSIYRWDQHDDGLWHPTKIDEGTIKRAETVPTQLQVVFAKPALADNVVWRAL